MVPCLLYDLENDPGETHNLASEKPKRLQALKEDMYAWRKRTGFAGAHQAKPQIRSPKDFYPLGWIHP